MGMLLTYVLLAISCTFLCSLLESVLLSITPSYLQQLANSHPASALRLQRLKNHVDRPLAAILSLNTLAQTVGAAGVGSETARLFGHQSVAIASGLMTLLLLILTELLPKTIGTRYWRELAIYIARPVEYLIWLFAPCVLLARSIARLVARPTPKPYIRAELMAMSQLGEDTGELAAQERRAILNLLHFSQLKATDVMTPRTVIFSLPARQSIAEWICYETKVPFSRIPLYETDKDDIIGYVHKQDVLLALAKQEGEKPLRDYLRPLLVVLGSTTLPALQQELQQRRESLALVVDEYGEVLGLVSMEDLIETMLGLEIVEAGDLAVDMQKLARQLWQKRIQEHGIHLSDDHR